MFVLLFIINIVHCWTKYCTMITLSCTTFSLPGGNNCLIVFGCLVFYDIFTNSYQILYQVVKFLQILFSCSQIYWLSSCFHLPLPYPLRVPTLLRPLKWLLEPLHSCVLGKPHLFGVSPPIALLLSLSFSEKGFREGWYFETLHVGKCL